MNDSASIGQTASSDGSITDATPPNGPTTNAPTSGRPTFNGPISDGPSLDEPTSHAQSPDALGPGRPILDWRVENGLTPYPHALAHMQRQVAAIRAGTAPETVWLVEHPPLYTAGTSARPADLTDPTRFPTFDAGRGGQWTYHGPGQRTAYVMLDLDRPHGRVPARDIRCFVHGLEEWLIRALDRFNVRGERREGRVGIWVTGPQLGTGRSGEAKIGAIGVRISRWVSWHGVALNVDPDLSHFSGIVPCGVQEHGVTSLAALGITATMAEADAALRAAWTEVFEDPTGSACPSSDREAGRRTSGAAGQRPPG